MPSRRSTTTPSTRRSSPQTRSTSAASWTPSTRMREARAVRARAPTTARLPEAVRWADADAPVDGELYIKGNDRLARLFAGKGRRVKSVYVDGDVPVRPFHEVAVPRWDFRAPRPGCGPAFHVERDGATLSTVQRCP